MTTAVSIEGVWKFYGDFPALENITLNVGDGACLALIGRNGAGKTTLLRMLAGLSKAAKGSITILGGDARAEHTRKRIGVLGHGIGVYEELSAFENLRLFARFMAWRILAKPRPSGWSEPDSIASPTAWCASFRAACGSAWRWRARFCIIRRCCCWTNLSPRLTIVPSRSCRGCSDGARRMAATIIMSTHQLREALELATDVALSIGANWRFAASGPAKCWKIRAGCIVTTGRHEAFSDRRWPSPGKICGPKFEARRPSTPRVPSRW